MLLIESSITVCKASIYGLILFQTFWDNGRIVKSNHVQDTLSELRSDISNSRRLNQILYLWLQFRCCRVKVSVRSDIFTIICETWIVNFRVPVTTLPAVDTSCNSIRKIIVVGDIAQAENIL